MWATDAQGRCTFANRAFEQAHGVRLADIAGRPGTEYLPAETAARWAGQERTVLDRGVPQVVEEREHIDGVVTVTQIVRFPVADAAGAIVAVGGVATDVTYRDRANRRLHELDARLMQDHRLRSLGTLAEGIAHDFNNVLLAVSGYAELAQQQLPIDVEARHYLAETLAAAAHGRDLVARLAGFGRRDEGERRPIRLAELVREGLRLVSVSAPPTVAVLVDLDEPVAPVDGDETQLLQVISNLCMNALHAMPDGGELQLALAMRDAPVAESLASRGLCPGPHVVLTVSDTGSGMDTAVLGHIFDPYFTTRADVGGSGLGLAVVQGIVAAHGGVVRVRSQPGRGSDFDVWLPVADGYSTTTLSR
jgi:PAS domain S-box-containing protein